MRRGDGGAEGRAMLSAFVDELREQLPNPAPTPVHVLAGVAMVVGRVAAGHALTEEQIDGLCRALRGGYEATKPKPIEGLTGIPNGSYPSEKTPA